MKSSVKFRSDIIKILVKDGTLVTQWVMFYETLNLETQLNCLRKQYSNDKITDYELFRSIWLELVNSHENKNMAFTILLETLKTLGYMNVHRKYIQCTYIFLK